MAKSKVKKGFFFYLMILVFILFGIFCVLTAILIFNPGQDVFGLNIRYISHIKDVDYYKLTGTETLIQSLNYDTVEFNGGYTSFGITYDQDAVNTKISFKPSVTALTRSEDTNFHLNIELVGSKLVISITEPEIWFGLHKGAIINFVCSKDTSFENVTFNINTASGAVSVGDRTNNTYSIKDLNIKTDTGAIAIYNNLRVASQNITIQAKESRMSINSNINGVLNIENAKGKIKIGTLCGDLRLNNSDTLEVDCKNVGGDVFIKGVNGYVKIENLGITEVQTGGTLNRVYGYVTKFAEGESLSGYIKGNLTTIDYVDNINIIVNSMVGNATITGRTGYVEIDKLYSQALIETTTGSVTIKESHNKLDIKTTKGNIEVVQQGQDAKTTIDTQNGKILASFAKIGNAVLSTKTSNIEIRVATGEAFNLTYATKNGIDVSWATSDWEKSGTASIFGATAETTNSINASAENGKIVLKDGFVA